jgi:hypothetical protein
MDFGRTDQRSAADIQRLSTHRADQERFLIQGRRSRRVDEKGPDSEFPGHSNSDPDRRTVSLGSFFLIERNP